MRCAVSNCGNNNRNGNRNKWRYFHFPKDEKQLKKWIEFCERDIANTSTACICNEHFTPKDFERNMQYELGFTRKNPTKLKPGALPTVHGSQYKVLKGERVKGKQQTPQEPKEREKPEEAHTNCSYSIRKQSFSNNKQTSQATAKKVGNSWKLEFLDPDKECEDIALGNANLVPSTEDLLYNQYIKEEECENANDTSHVGLMELEIIDPLNPQTNADQHVEINGSETDIYVRHLEVEVSTLRRQVISLQDERKKLVDEIQNLRAAAHNAREEHAEATDNQKATKSSKGSPIKRTVLLYTTNIKTIRKLCE